MRADEGLEKARHPRKRDQETDAALRECRTVRRLVFGYRAAEVERILLDQRMLCKTVREVSRKETEHRLWVTRLQKALEKHRETIRRQWNEVTDYRRQLGLPVKETADVPGPPEEIAE